MSRQARRKFRRDYGTTSSSGVGQFDVTETIFEVTRSGALKIQGRGKSEIIETSQRDPNDSWAESQTRMKALIDEQRIESCFQCNTAGIIKTQKCSRCQVATYCNADCQKAHWRGGHKSTCQSHAAASAQFDEPKKMPVKTKKALAGLAMRYAAVLLAGLVRTGGVFLYCMSSALPRCGVHAVCMSHMGLTIPAARMVRMTAGYFGRAEGRSWTSRARFGCWLISRQVGARNSLRARLDVAFTRTRERKHKRVLCKCPF